MKASLLPEQTDEFTHCHANLVKALRSADTSQYVLTHPESIFYLTGATFEALERPFFLLVGADGLWQLLVPVLEMDHLQKAWGISEETTLTYREFPAPAGQGWRDRLLDGGVLSAGFGFEDSTPHSIAATLLEAGGRAMDLLEPLRLVKSDWEVGQIERAATYADWGIERLLRNAYHGATVAETYATTQQLMRKIVREVPHWDALATKVIAAAWPALLSAQPHAIPNMGDRLRSGPHVAMVLARVNGYAAESERTALHLCAERRATRDVRAADRGQTGCVSHDPPRRRMRRDRRGGKPLSRCVRVRGVPHPAAPLRAWLRPG
ncbi:MAG TPA: aminopeptidase P family N-terminal domain-containing protein [Burkholderiaceae bacterium]